MQDTTSDNRESGVPHADVTYWLNEIAAARKREKTFRKDGEKILEVYSGERQAETPFNILFSNTETMLPALYSIVPRPVVQRRYKDGDPLGKAAAMAGQRALEFLLDTNTEDYETFDQAMKAAVLDGLLPGRGVTCIKYDADIVEPPAEGEEPAASYVNSEFVCPDSKTWNRVYFGYAKKWSKVPWIAYEEYLDEEESERLFGKEISAKITFTTGESCDDDESDERSSKSDDERNQGERKTALVYQIWDKDGGRKIRYISPQYQDGALKEDDDPLGLTGFFNCPKPIQFIDKSADLVPTAVYKLYENQAEELNEITRRIKHVTKAIQAKGLYDGELGSDIQNLLNASENALVPTDKGASLAAEKGLDNAVWFWPVEKLIVVLRELYGARESCKKVIYEITGIADILRGSSSASETLGAQEIKERWGGLRLKRLQREVQRYARDMLRLMLDVATQKFSADTWAKMTGLPFATAEQKMQAQAVAQAAQMSGQQPDQQTMAILQAPAWDDVLAMLKNDMARAYRIDIETNSTVEAEAVEDQKNIAEVMNALAQYLNGVAPLVIKGALPFEAAQGMMLAIVRRFRFGPEIEDYIKEMKPPQPEGDGGQAEKLKAAQEKIASDTEAAKQQLAAQGQQQQAALEKERMRAGQQLDAQAYQLQIDRANFEFEKRLAEQAAAHQAEMARMQQDMVSNAMMAELKTVLAGHKRDVQSCLDKHAVKVEKMNAKAKEPEAM